MLYLFCESLSQDYWEKFMLPWFFKFIVSFDISLCIFFVTVGINLLKEENINTGFL